MLIDRWKTYQEETANVATGASGLDAQEAAFFAGALAAVGEMLDNLARQVARERKRNANPS